MKTGFDGAHAPEGEQPLGWRREREHYRDQNQQRSHPFEMLRDLQQPRLLT
jgi:hypothetical protein